MTQDAEIYKSLRRYADAWEASDFATIAEFYRDDVVFHYFGRSPLAGSHRGKKACLQALKAIHRKTARRLLAIRDVLAGSQYGVIIAVEHFEREGATLETERLLRYRLSEGRIAECWVYDEDQRAIDRYLADEPAD